MTEAMILAGDIGGTKTTLALISPRQGLAHLAAEASYPSQEYAGLKFILDDYLKGVDQSIGRVVFGVAGPVLKGKAKITNLPWTIEADEVADRLGIDRVRLLNDLEATANAIPFLPAEDFHTINDVPPAERGNVAVLAPGTGLGEAFLVWDGERYRAFPTEGGHATFAPQDELAFALQQYLMRERGFKGVSYEHVSSGMGIANIFAFLRDSGFAPEPDWLAEQVAAAEDPTPVIVNAALNDDAVCEICVKTMEIFVSALASEAGNLALKVLATGGVYLGGGIPPRILKLLTPEKFMPIFTNKGLMRDLLAGMPVNVILNSKAALMGAAWYAIHYMD